MGVVRPVGPTNSTPAAGRHDWAGMPRARERWRRGVGRGEGERKGEREQEQGVRTLIDLGEMAEVVCEPGEHPRQRELRLHAVARHCPPQPQVHPLQYLQDARSVEYQ